MAIAKLAAAFFTGSSAMLSESVHSIADCSNEIVLMAGGRFSKHKTDGDHPFGLYRAKYLASFVVATLLFFVGGFFSTSEAVKKLFAIAEDPHCVTSTRWNCWWRLSWCLSALVWKATACIKASRKRTSVWSARVWPIWVCSVLEAYQVGGACVRHYGRHACFDRLGIRRAGIGLAILFDNEIFDAFGGLMVGLVLIAGSLLLMFKSGSLLIGEAVDSDTRKKIEQAVISTPGVERLLNMQTVHMSEDDILLCVKVQTSKLDRDYDVETVNKIERSVRTALPWFRFEIYVEPDLYRADHKIVS